MRKGCIETVIKHMEENELPNFDFADTNNCLIPVFEKIFGVVYLADFLELSSLQSNHLFTPSDWCDGNFAPYGIPSTATQQDAINHLKRFVFFDGDITKCSPTQSALA